MLDSVNIELTEADADEIIINPQFKKLTKSLKVYIGPATAQLHQLEGSKQPAIKDENRNAIIPEINTQIKDKIFYFSVKGCGAYEDMFYGEELTKEKVKLACRDKTFIRKIDNIQSFEGFIMSENWMGESPYGAQSQFNATKELEWSKLATLDNIKGAHICPVIGILQLPEQIVKVAHKFYWFRRYHDPFYQVIRLVPSKARLFFESSHVMTDERQFFKIFGIKTRKQVEQFELNFIKSGIALLSLYPRTVHKLGEEIQGLIYHDVWFDKDCVVAPDGTIHFADLEGLEWLKEDHIREYDTTFWHEWQKLVYEFLFALVRVNSYRLMIEGREDAWSKQRSELALFIQLALDKDPYCIPKLKDNNLIISVEVEGFPTIDIPLIEEVN